MTAVAQLAELGGELSASCPVGGLGVAATESPTTDDVATEVTAYVEARGAQLRRTAYLLCSDWHEADDLVQTTLTKLYIHWLRARKATSLDAYARQVLVRSWLDTRRRGWLRWRADEPVPDLAEGPFGSQDTNATEDRMVMRTALAKLPPRQRAVLVLRFVEDLGVAETAVALGCATGTVKSQTSAALAALRKLVPADAWPRGAGLATRRESEKEVL